MACASIVRSTVTVMPLLSTISMTLNILHRCRSRSAIPTDNGCTVFVEVFQFHLGYLPVPLPSAVEHNEMAQCDFESLPSWSYLWAPSTLKEFHFPGTRFMEERGHFDHIGICWENVRFIALSLVECCVHVDGHMFSLLHVTQLGKLFRLFRFVLFTRLWSISFQYECTFLDGMSNL